MTKSLRDRVLTYLAAHGTATFTPGELTKAIQWPSVTQVREELEELRAAGDVVTCRVIRAGVSDELFRISAGGMPPSFNPSAPPVTIDMRAALRAAAAPRAERRGTRDERALWHGAAPLRQLAIAEFIRGLGRPGFPSEILAHFRARDPSLRAEVVYCGINAACKGGFIARLGRCRNHDNGLMSWRYGLPGRVYPDEPEFSQGSGGEAGNGKAGRKPAAPRGDEATRPSAGKTAPEGAGVRAGPLFGLLPGGALAIRADEVAVDLSPRVTRELLAWIGDRAGADLVGRVLP
jgi:hypothetical protein